MKAKKDNLMTLEDFKTKHYGKRGAAKREELEAGYESFRIGALLHEAKLEKRDDPGGTCRKSRYY